MIICYMKAMGAAKHEQIIALIRGALKLEMLQNKGGGWYQICYDVL